VLHANIKPAVEVFRSVGVVPCSKPAFINPSLLVDKEIIFLVLLATIGAEKSEHVAAIAIGPTDRHNSVIGNIFWFRRAKVDAVRF